MSTYLNLNLPSRQLLLNEINAANHTALTLNQVVFGIPKPIFGITDRNTEIEVSGRPGGIYRGDLYHRYKRYNLQELFNQFGTLHLPWPGLPNNRPANTHRLIPLLNEHYGLELRPEDVLFEKIIGQVGEWTLKAAPESIAWMGQVQVVWDGKTTDLEQLWTVRLLDGLKYPEPYDPTKGFLQVLSYGVDATPFAEQLLAWELNRPYTQVEAEWEIGTHLLDTEWESQPTASPNNIYGAQMVYRGPIQAPYHTDLGNKYSHVAVIQPSAACTGWLGIMLLHFNLPPHLA